MTTPPRAVVLLVEPLVLAVWTVVDLLAEVTVLVVRVRQAARLRAWRRSGMTDPGAGAEPGARPGSTSYLQVTAPARTLADALTR